MFLKFFKDFHRTIQYVYMRFRNKWLMIMFCWKITIVLLWIIELVEEKLFAYWKWYCLMWKSCCCSWVSTCWIIRKASWVSVGSYIWWPLINKKIEKYHRSYQFAKPRRMFRSRSALALERIYIDLFFIFLVKFFLWK